MAYTLGRKIVQNKSPLISFETGKNLVQMWEKYFEKKFKIK
jgi:hypothetical protein